MNKQEIFTKVKNHLLKQMKRATLVDTSVKNLCVYRDESGNKCAIGCLIPDEYWSLEINTWSLSTLLGKRPEFKDFLNIKESEDEAFLRSLQRIHDMYNPAEWGKKLEEAADYWQLEFNKID